MKAKFVVKKDGTCYFIHSGPYRCELCGGSFPRSEMVRITFEDFSNRNPKTGRPKKYVDKVWLCRTCSQPIIRFFIEKIVEREEKKWRRFGKR